MAQVRFRALDLAFWVYILHCTSVRESLFAVLFSIPLEIPRGHEAVWKPKNVSIPYPHGAYIMIVYGVETNTRPRLKGSYNTSWLMQHGKQSADGQLPRGPQPGP